jgi:hypothetical protein
VVTASSVPPVIPKLVPPGVGVGAVPVSRSRRPLPVVVLDAGSPRAANINYVFSAVDKSGRVADRSPIQALGWTRGDRLDIRERAGVIVVSAAADGVHCIGNSGHLHLPLAVRRWCHLTAGDRILLAANRATGVLLAHPLVVLDRLLADLEAALWGGETA